MSRILPKTYYGEIYTELEARSIVKHQHFTYQGEVGTISELIKNCNIQLGSLSNRMYDRTLEARIQKGMTIDEILETPFMYDKDKVFEYNGHQGTPKELLKFSGSPLTSDQLTQSLAFEVDFETLMSSERRIASPAKKYTLRGISAEPEDLYHLFQDELQVQLPAFISRLQTGYKEEELFLPPSEPRFPAAPKNYPKFISPDGTELFVEKEFKNDFGEVIYHLTETESNDKEKFELAVAKMKEQVVVDGEILRYKDLFPAVNSSDRINIIGGRIANQFTYSFPMHLLRVVDIDYVPNGARRPKRIITVDPHDLYDPLQGGKDVF